MLNTLRGRLTLIMIILAVLPVVVVGAIITFRAFNVQTDQAEDLQAEAALRVAREIDTFLHKAESDLRLVTEVRGLKDLSIEDQEAVLSELQTTRDIFDEVALLDETGQEIVRLSRREIVTGTDLVSRVDTAEFTVPVTARIAYFGPVELNLTTGEPLMTIAIPIIDKRTDAVVNVLVGELRFRAVWDLIADQEFAEDQDIYVVATNEELEALEGISIEVAERVVAHRNPSVVLADTAFETDDLSRLTTGLNGYSVILSTEHFELGEQKFTVVSELKETTALKTAYATVYTIAVAMVAVVLFTGGVGFWLMTRVARPIETMSRAAVVLGSGDFDVHVEPVGTREFRLLAQSFNDMSAQIQNFIGTLEARVQARTADLRLAAQVSEQAATILDPDVLLSQIVELTKEYFGLYHSHVYLLDADGDNLVLAAGAGEPGRIMRDRGHSIPASAELSLVARAAREKTAVIVADTVQEPDFLANPLLPDTRSEAALPLVAGQRVLGVLDVQSEQVGRFDADLIAVLNTLAGQITVAIDNARLFSEVERTSRHEQALSTVTEAIQRAQSMDEVLQVAARELGRALRVPHAAIELKLETAAETDAETEPQPGN